VSGARTAGQEGVWGHRAYPCPFEQWAKKINVPVFLVGQFQDEQTGGHWPELIKNLKKNPNVWVTLQNGVHVDSLGPSTITRWAEFMNLFVAERVPVVPD